MSYKVEVSTEEQESLLRETLGHWSRQEHDVHLVSTEGHKIFSHKVILSFYSSVLREILNDPVSAYSSGPVTISVPASAACISTMLGMLVHGKVGTDNMNLEDQVRDATKALGISIRNFEIEHRKKVSTASTLTITKMPAGGQEEVIKVTSKDDPRANKTESAGSLRTYKKRKGKCNTSVVKNGMKIELKDFLIEETPETNETQISEDTLIEETASKHGDTKSEEEEQAAKLTCDVCLVMCKDAKFLDKHKFKAHGIRKKKEKAKKVKASSSSAIVKEESVNLLEIEDTDSVHSVKNTPNETKSIFMNQTMKESSSVTQKGKSGSEHSIKKKSSPLEQLRPQTKTKEEMKMLRPGSEKSLNTVTIQSNQAKKVTKPQGPSPCALCPKVFDTPENLLKHTNLRHPGAKLPSVAIGIVTNKLKEIKNIKGYQCPMCDKMFSSVKFKEAHMLKFHGDVNPSLDPLSTDTENLLKETSKTKTVKVITKTEGGVSSTLETEEIQETTDLCGYCGDKFDNLDILNEHIAMVHA